jgi:hypothetical protein
LFKDERSCAGRCRCNMSCARLLAPLHWDMMAGQHRTAQKLDLGLTVKSISYLCDLFPDCVLLFSMVVVHVSEADAAG